MCLFRRLGRRSTWVVEWCVYITQAKIDFYFCCCGKFLNRFVVGIYDACWFSYDVDEMSTALCSIDRFVYGTVSDHLVSI